MMRGVKHFFQGVVMQSVDYSTRHCSRPYDWGVCTGMVLFCSSPFVFVFAIGVLVGAWIW